MSKSCQELLCKKPCKAEKCQKTLITQADIGFGDRFLISRPGLYCLCSDVTFSKGVAIEIAAPNVTLDLCQHTINGSGSGQIAVMVRENSELVKNVVVQNGQIVDLALEDSEGVFSATLSFSKCENITIRNLIVNKGARALLVGSVDNLQVSDYKVSNMDLGGIDVFDSTDLHFERCHGSNLQNFLAFTSNFNTIVGQPCEKIQILQCSCSTIARSGAAFFNGAKDIAIDGLCCQKTFFAVNLNGLDDEGGSTVANAVIRNVHASTTQICVKLQSARNVILDNISSQNMTQLGIDVDDCSEMCCSNCEIIDQSTSEVIIAIRVLNSSRFTCKNTKIVSCAVGVLLQETDDSVFENVTVVRCGAGFLVGKLDSETTQRYTFMKNCSAVNCNAFGFAVLHCEQAHLQDCIANSSEKQDPKIFTFNHGIFLSNCACCLVKNCKANFNEIGFADFFPLDENSFIGNCAFANNSNYNLTVPNSSTVKTFATAQSAFDNLQVVKQSKNRSLQKETTKEVIEKTLGTIYNRLNKYKGE